MRRLISLTLLVTVLAVAGACGAKSDSSSSSEAASSSDAAWGALPCPVDPIDIVVTVNQWSDIVERLAGECGDVTTIIAGDVGDPHDFEPTPADNAAFTNADLVVMNGLDYDHWAEAALDTLPNEPAVVNGGEVVGLVEGDNPHLWYSPAYVGAIADAVTAELTALEPDAAAYFDTQGVAWDASMQSFYALVEELSTEAAGRTYAATESVFDYLATDIGLVDKTPAGFRSAAANESDPSPGDVAEFDELLRRGVDVLVYNVQTEGAVPEQLREVAEQAGVPIVEVTETVPDGATSFSQWQLDQLTALKSALGLAG